MLPLIVDMLPNIVTNLSPYFVVDMYPDVGYDVSDIALNMSVGNMSQMWTHLKLRVVREVVHGATEAGKW